MQQFKVGDKVSGHPIRGLSHRKGTSGVVVGFEDGLCAVNWEGVSTQLAEPYELILLKPKQKGLCMFLNKVQKEYSNG